MDLVKTPFRAGEMHFFDLEGTFHREGRRKIGARMRAPPIYTRCFSLTVRTPLCGHTFGEKRRRRTEEEEQEEKEEEEEEDGKDKMNRSCAKTERVDEIWVGFL